MSESKPYIIVVIIKLKAIVSIKSLDNFNIKTHINIPSFVKYMQNQLSPPERVRRACTAILFSGITETPSHTHMCTQSLKGNG